MHRVERAGWLRRARCDGRRIRGGLALGQTTLPEPRAQRVRCHEYCDGFRRTATRGSSAQDDDDANVLLSNTALASATPLRPSTPGRELAGRALLAGCTQQRTGELLGVCWRTVGRLAEIDVTVALHDAEAIDQARTCLAATAGRGSTPEERDAAEAWLRDVHREAQQGAWPEPRAPKDQVPAPAAAPLAPAPARAPPPRGRRPGHAEGRHPPTAPAVRPARPVRRMGSGAAPSPLAPRAVRRPDTPATAHSPSQRAYRLRVRRRKRSGQTLTMGEALTELLADITEAARTIGRLLQPAGPRVR